MSSASDRFRRFSAHRHRHHLGHEHYDNDDRRSSSSRSGTRTRGRWREQIQSESKLSRLSHEELMIALVYWKCPPSHRVTAMYIQKSMRSGDLMITGSDSGEFVIWKPSNTMHHPAFDRLGGVVPVPVPGPAVAVQSTVSGSSTSNSTDTPDTPLLVDTPLSVDSVSCGMALEWIPIAMTFSTNTSPVVSILGSFQHKEQAAFMGN